MDVEGVKNKVQGWLEPKLAEEREYFLVDIKLPGINKIQVFIDGDNGIQIDKCVEFSRYLEKFLDEEKTLGERYVLEVSSPGMENPLKVLRQYKRRIGSEVNIVVKDGRRLEGVLKDADADKVKLEQKGTKKHPEIKTLEIPFSDIKRTKLNFNFKNG